MAAPEWFQAELDQLGAAAHDGDAAAAVFDRLADRDPRLAIAVTELVVDAAASDGPGADRGRPRRRAGLMAADMPERQRVSWTCGHSADVPAVHDWSHRHWCPACAPGRVDEKDPCPGIEYAVVTFEPPVEKPAKCFLCDEPGLLYPAGVRCDDHSPAAVRADDDSDGLG